MAERLKANHDESRLIFAANAFNGGIIGYMAINHIDAATPAISVSVVEQEHRKGYAYEMLTALFTWIGEHYTNKTALYCVRPDNKASIALALKLGGQLVPPTSLIEQVAMRTYLIPIKNIHETGAVCET